jgi:hypothetical protein
VLCGTHFHFSQEYGAIVAQKKRDPRKGNQNESAGPLHEPHPDASSYAEKFSGKYAHRIIEGGVGHNLPQEAPRAFAEAVVEVDGY